MANFAGIPPGNETQEVQLFSREGAVLVTVAIPLGVTVVTWQGKFFRLSEGRFVESSAFALLSAVETSDVIKL